MTRRKQANVFTDADGRTFRRLCNRCNAAWQSVGRCDKCGGVEFRIAWINQRVQRRLFR